MAKVVIPLAPLAEQQRIVEAIEAQFTRLDVGVAALKRLRTNLKRYKAAVLKAACEGRLVEQDPDDEPASELLKRILKERRVKWAAEQQAKGKDPRNLTYKEPVAPDTADLPDLPEGWVWATIEQLITEIRSGTTDVPLDDETDFPILRSSSVRPFSVDYGDIRYLSNAQKSENLLSQGDVLFTRLSGSLDYVGNAAQVNYADVNGIAYPDRLFRAVPLTQNIGAFIELWFNSPYLREKIRNAAKSSAGHQRISQSDIKPQNVALPPQNEQIAIINEVQ